ncbi:MAG: cohesin domain-containing protein [Candidatus Eisenbacteria bacterium]
MTRLFPADRAALRPRGRFGPVFAVALLSLLALTAARALATDSLEPNNTAGEGRRLTSGSPISSYISDFGDLDYYVIAFGQAGDISIQLTSVPNDADYVLSLWSFDDQGNLVAEGEADQGGNGGDESLSGQVNGAGVLVIEVSGFAGAFNANDSYQLSTTFPTGWPGSGQDGNEPNDDPTVATALTSQQAKAGIISQPGDIDFYRVTLSTSNNITVDVTSIPAGTDYDVRFYAVNNGVFEPIAESVNGAGQDEHLEVTEAAPGTYYVAVYGFGGAYNSSDGYSIVASFGGGGGGNQPPTIALSAPNGGESWQVGSQHAITWTASDPNAGDPLQISLEYSVNGGAQWTSIVSGLSNSGSYNWTIPNNPSTQSRVRATVSDGQVQAQDESNASFTIVAQPAGQNTLAIGTGSGQSGTQVTVPLTLDNDDAVKGLQTDISFDPAVVSYNIGQATSRGATMTYSAAVVGGNKVRVLLFYQTGDVLAAGNGTVANLTFNLIGAGGTQSALTPPRACSPTRPGTASR